MPVPTSGASALDQRHRLTLHVGAHQRAVGVVVLQERDQRCGYRHQLLRRDVDRGDVLRPDETEVALAPHRHEILSEPTITVHWRIGLRDDELSSSMAER